MDQIGTFSACSVDVPLSNLSLFIENPTWQSL
jgi:hypothetical protein